MPHRAVMTLTVPVMSCSLMDVAAAYAQVDELMARFMGRQTDRRLAEQTEAKTTFADDYHLEDQIGYIIRKGHQRASEIFFEIMSQFEISPMQFSTLIKLHDFKETSQNRLGRLVDMDPATTLGVVSRLKKQGLIKQRQDPTDGRRLLLSLTDKGEKKALAMRAVASEVSRATLKPLTAAEGKTLARLLRKIS